MRRGSIFVCMKCHKSGVDGHPALQCNPAEMPSPEPPPPVIEIKPPAAETRRTKRARLFGVSAMCSKEANPL